MFIGTSKIHPRPAHLNTLAKALHTPLHPLIRKQFLCKNTTTKHQPVVMSLEKISRLNQNFLANFIANTEKLMPKKTMPFLVTTPVEVYVVYSFCGGYIFCIILGSRIPASFSLSITSKTFENRYPLCIQNWRVPYPF